MRFADLKFRKHPNDPNGVQCFAEFPNGYGASVARGWGTYGGKDGLYELAVLDAGGHITYDTPITSDVIGYLTEDGVTRVLAQIEALLPAKAYKVRGKNKTVIS